MPFSWLTAMVQSVVNAVLYDRGGACYNIVAYGADPTGVADSTAAIQLAIETAGVNGKLCWPKGTYRITSTLVPNSGQLWEGVGAGTVLEWDASSFANAVQHSDGVSKFRTITDFHVSGIKFTNTHGSGTAFGLNIGASDHIPQRITYEGCEGDHCSLNVTGGSDHNLYDNYVHDTQSDRAIGCTTSIPGTNFDNSNSRVHDNLIVNATNVGVMGQGMLSGEVSFNVLINAGSGGSSFGIDMNAARDTTVAFNVVNGSNGILFEQSSGTGGHAIIVGNTIIGTAQTGGTGIQVWPNAGVGAYAGITIKDNLISTILLGIYVVNELYADITANYLDSIGQDAIVISQSTGNFTRVTIQENVVSGFAQHTASSHGVNTNSANVYVNRNVFDGTGGTTPVGVAGIAGAGTVYENLYLNVTTQTASLNAAVGVISTDASGNVTVHNLTATHVQGTGGVQTKDWVGLPTGLADGDIAIDGNGNLWVETSSTLSQLIIPIVEVGTLANDVAMTTANTAYDGPGITGPIFSVGYPNQIWLLIGHVVISDASASAITAKLWNGSTIYDEAETTIGVAGDSGELTLMAVVTGVNEQFSAKITAFCSASSATMRKNPPHNSGASGTASQLTAIRLN